MSGSIPFGRALAAAAGAAQGQQQNVGRMLSVWGGGRDWRGQRSAQLREDQQRQENEYFRRLQQEEAQKQQTDLQEQAFQNNVALENLRQTGRMDRVARMPGARSLEDRLAEIEARERIKAEHRAPAGFKPQTIEEAAELARQTAAARAESAGFRPKTLEEAVALAGGKAGAVADAQLPTALKKIEASGGQQRQNIAARGAETRTTLKEKSGYDRLRDVFNWEQRDKAQGVSIAARAALQNQSLSEAQKRLVMTLEQRAAEAAQRAQDQNLNREQRAQLAAYANDIRLQIATMGDTTRREEGAANRTSREGIAGRGVESAEKRSWWNLLGRAEEGDRSRANQQDLQQKRLDAKKNDDTAREKSRTKAISDLQKQRSNLAVKAEQMANADYRAATDAFKEGPLAFKKAGETDEQFEARRQSFLAQKRQEHSRALFRGAALRTSLATIPTMTHEEAFGELQDLAQIARDQNMDPQDFATLNDALLRRFEETKR